MILTHRLADNLNRIGLVLGFFSFWLAAPEFIGEQRLKSWELVLAASIQRVPKAVQRVTGYALSFLTCGFLIGLVVSVFAGDISVLFSPFFLLTGTLVALIGIPLSFFFVRFPLEGLVRRLANDSHVRQKALFLAGLLFTVSFVLQFVATFQDVVDR